MAFLLALLSPSFAQAHSMAITAVDWASGFAHPLQGLDHILAMLAVGFWAMQLRGLALWLLPLTFVSVMGIGDYTRGTFDNGGDVPRMPPLRYGVQVSYDKNEWSSNVRLTRGEAQTNAGENETTTPAYLLLNLGTQYKIAHFAQSDILLFAKGKNLLDENIRNAIYNQYIYVPGTTTLSSMISSIGEVETNGIDTTINFDRVMGSDFDVKVNTTILDATIIANPLNPKLVGNQMPLMPNYRTNMLTTYHYGKDWDFSVGTRYQSNMNSQPDNKDLQLTYYGAFTESVYVDLKTTYHFNQRKGHVSVGIDNVNDYQAFYNHPLPMRTFFAQVGYKF